MVRVENGDIVTGEYPVFCHQVNCKGVMGAGLAKQIRNEYPEVYHEYKYLCSNGNAELGSIQCVKTSDGKICVNMFSQYGYGRDGQYTNYDAFEKCLKKIRAFVCSRHTHLKEISYVAFPMYIGCGLAGGNWKVISGLISNFAETLPCDVVLVKYRKD